MRDDETFGDTIVELFRRRGVTSLFICNADPGHSDSVLHRSIVDNANVLINFDRHLSRGENQSVAQIVKTSNMGHRRETFGIELANGQLELNWKPMLIRTKDGEQPRPIDIKTIFA